jgi:hypothetical protein
MCRKLEKWDSLMGSLSSKRNQTSKFCIYRSCLLDMRTAKKNLVYPNALGCRPKGAGRIFSHNTPQKNSGGGGCVFYTSPNYTKSD